MSSFPTKLTSHPSQRLRALATNSAAETNYNYSGEFDPATFLTYAVPGIGIGAAVAFAMWSFMKKMMLKRRNMEKDSAWFQKTITAPEEHVNRGKDEEDSAESTLNAVPKASLELPVLDFGRPFEPEYVLPPAIEHSGESKSQAVKRKPVSAPVEPPMDKRTKMRSSTFSALGDTRRYSDWKTAFQNQKNYFADASKKEGSGGGEEEENKGVAVGI